MKEWKKIKIPRKESHNGLKVLNTLCSRVRYFNIGWLSVAKALKIKYIPHLGFVVESYLSKNKALWQCCRLVRYCNKRWSAKEIDKNELNECKSTQCSGLSHIQVSIRNIFKVRWKNMNTVESKVAAIIQDW